jgi:uncharacterized membrane protein
MLLVQTVLSAFVDPSFAPFGNSRMRRVGIGRALLAVGLMGLGVLALVYGDFALQWQPVPSWVPWRDVLARLCGLLELALGVGLLWGPAVALSSRVLLVYLTMWLALLKVPHIVMAPMVELNWNGAGEIAVVVAGALVLLATLGEEWGGIKLAFSIGDRGVRNARLLFAIALPAIGLSHFVYHAPTAAMVPAWLPERGALAYFTGAVHVAAGIGVAFAIYPRLAATLEAAMISVFTLLVWVPGTVANATSRLEWTALIISWTIGAGAWVVAESYSAAPWLSARRDAS